ncbi:glyoxylate/hydroxypyruvate reductase A [Caballeronia sp. LZ034LL]|uniref:2-hydroxyacid dehydrogenase n=1 Tax=Caballeronia sp. LZ034LL TaxID=3038567 RepID=UPI00285E1D1B|nr:glyoxylate/hydroxypyruvate reductase A [Caballeronia sp. LZ034LL]MDR5836252.1 glyoxylate/hydroxypyruvate reductase A [Caballeronia sp. LZ034LL]
MLLLVNSGGPGAVGEWQDHFAKWLPELEVRGWNDPEVDDAQVDFVLVWEPTPGRLARMPALKIVFSAAAGVDHIMADRSVPAHLPIVRMVTPETTERMSDYVMAACFGITRDFAALHDAQRRRSWKDELIGRRSGETNVAVLGLGELGAACAQRLALNGFQVRGWSRSPRNLPGVTCFSGNEALDALLDNAHIVVNLLPDTAQTRGMIDAALLAKLPVGASIVNAGRGPQVVLDDVLAALDEGRLRSAWLDVFEQEPLDPESRLWSHPGVVVTPHVASLPSRGARAEQVARALREHLEGKPLQHVYDRVLGY